MIEDKNRINSWLPEDCIWKSFKLSYENNLYNNLSLKINLNNVVFFKVNNFDWTLLKIPEEMMYKIKNRSIFEKEFKFSQQIFTGILDEKDKFLWISNKSVWAKIFNEKLVLEDLNHHYYIIITDNWYCFIVWQKTYKKKWIMADDFQLISSKSLNLWTDFRENLGVKDIYWKKYYKISLFEWQCIVINENIFWKWNILSVFETDDKMFILWVNNKLYIYDKNMIKDNKLKIEKEFDGIFSLIWISENWKEIICLSNVDKNDFDKSFWKDFTKWYEPSKYLRKIIKISI